MLISNAHLQGIATGEINLAFRKWRSPTVRTGGTLRTAIGVLAIEAVEVVSERELSPADAKAAGFPSLQELLESLRSRNEGTLYRIRLRLSGPDPREQLRQQTGTNADEREQLLSRLDRLDRLGKHGPWTNAVLRAIAARPNLRAAELAEQLGFEKEWLKTSIRKLKELGLTESLVVGYRLSPRGHALLEAMRL